MAWSRVRTTSSPPQRAGGLARSVAMISFTGSTAAGRRVGELAARQLKKVSLELGGINPLVILDDA